jgi:hypothetical protein
MIPHGVIDVRTAPYQDGSLGYTATGVAILPKGSDHSRQVSDVLFKDEGTTAYTRELYNLFREAYLGYLNTDNLKEIRIDFEHLAFDSETGTNILLQQTPGWNLFGGVGDRSSSRTNGKNIPHITVVASTAFGIEVELSPEATRIKDEFIRSLNGLSDMDKVTKIDQYIQEHMAYGSDGYDYRNRFFTSSTEGACMHYTMIANLLFHEADIPIFAISGGINGETTNHAVNFIYIDGKWQYYDSTIGDTDGKSQYYQLLFGDDGRQKTKFAFENERFAQFMMEAIMPRSIYR